MHKRCREIMDELILNGELEEITWFKFAPKQELKLRLKDMLDDEVDEKYLLSEKLVSYFEKHQEEQKEKGNGFGWQPLDENSETSFTITNPGKIRPNETYIKLKQTHTLNIKGNDSIKRIYSSDGLCPSLTTMQGGHREPKVAIEKEIIKLFDIPKEILNDNERQRRVYSPEGISPAVIARSDSAKILVNGLIEVSDEVRVKEATKLGYKVAEEGDSINISVPSSKTRRGRVEKQVAQTLDTACNQVVFFELENKDKKLIHNPLKGISGKGWHFEQNVYSENSFCTRALKASQGSGNIQKVITNKYIFRKLTPRECFRLQGFDDSFIFPPKMSDTQLYKQAGNGMSRNILDMIFTQIFKSKNFDLSSNS